MGRRKRKPEPDAASDGPAEPELPAEDGLPSEPDLAPPTEDDSDDLPGYKRRKKRKGAKDPLLASSISEGLYGLIDMGHDRAADATGYEGWRINEKEQRYFKRLCTEMAKYLGAEVLPIILVIGCVVIIESGKFMAWRKWKKEGEPGREGGEDVPDQLPTP